MTAKPLVSIIMPTYNRADSIVHAVNSALKQTYSNIEVLVVDDGSTDQTQVNLQNIKGISYIQQEHGGQARARNTGLQHASGELIASLDSDDIWYPDFLETCVPKLITGGHDFVFANWDQLRPDGTTTDFLSQDIFLRPYFQKITNDWVTLNNEEIRKIYLNGCPSPSSSLIMKRTSIGAGWNNEIRIGDDWYMYLDMILKTPRTAAFTLKRLWSKRIDKKNIYDGRKRNEVLENLYDADLQKMIQAFESRLSKDELKILRNKHVYSLVELAKHNLIREFNFREMGKLLSRSFSIDAVRTFKSIPEVISFGLGRKTGRYKIKQNRPH